MESSFEFYPLDCIRYLLMEGSLKGICNCRAITSSEHDKYFLYIDWWFGQEVEIVQTYVCSPSLMAATLVHCSENDNIISR